jgi:hypothetical protein
LLGGGELADWVAYGPGSLTDQSLCAEERAQYYGNRNPVPEGRSRLREGRDARAGERAAPFHGRGRRTRGGPPIGLLLLIELLIRKSATQATSIV